MKKLLLGAAAIALIATPALAQTLSLPEGPYLQVNIGSSLAGDTDAKATLPGVGVGSESFDLDPGFFGSVELGTTFANKIGLAAEALYFKNDIDTDDADVLVGVPLDASVRTMGVMANAFYNVGTAGPLFARVGAGVGYGEAKYDLLGGSDKNDGVMWQLMASAAYPVSDKLSLDVGYRYLRAPDYDFTDPTGSISADTSAHIVTIGSRFSF